MGFGCSPLILLFQISSSSKGGGVLWRTRFFAYAAGGCVGGNHVEAGLLCRRGNADNFGRRRRVVDKVRVVLELSTGFACWVWLRASGGGGEGRTWLMRALLFDATLHVLRAEAGISPPRASHFFCFAKRSNQEKATPRAASPSLRYGATCGARGRRGPRKLAALRHARPLFRLPLRSSAHPEGRGSGSGVPRLLLAARQLRLGRAWGPGGVGALRQRGVAASSSHTTPSVSRSASASRLLPRHGPPTHRPVSGA